METPQWVNKELSYYRNNELKWVRELTQYYEEYFDKEFREDLILLNFQEVDLKYVFVSTLNTLYKIISQDSIYVGSGEVTFFNLIHSIQNPAQSKEISLNKEKIQNLFFSVTFPFRTFGYRHSITFSNLIKSVVDISNLKKSNIKLEREKEIYQANVELLKDVMKDEKEEQRKKIENMAQSYIEACEKFRKFNPSNLQLSEISGLTERLWREQKRNKYFLKYLMSEIQKKYNLTNKKNEVGREFWKKAIDYINTKIQFISDPDGFKFKLHQIIELKDQTQIDNRFAKSKSKKIKGIQSQNKDMGSVEDEVAECFVCGEPIESGNLCNDCEKDFPIKRE